MVNPRDIAVNVEEEVANSRLLDNTRSQTLIKQVAITKRIGSYVAVGYLLACLTSQQHVSVSQVRIYSDNCTCCHTEIGVADQAFRPTQSQYTDQSQP